MLRAARAATDARRHSARATSDRPFSPAAPDVFADSPSRSRSPENQEEHDDDAAPPSPKRLKICLESGERIPGLEALVECPMSYDLMIDPTTGDCGHTFCKRSVEGMKPSADGPVQCPVCNKPITHEVWPTEKQVVNGAQRMPTNFVIRDLISEVIIPGLTPERRLEHLFKAGAGFHQNLDGYWGLYGGEPSAKTMVTTYKECADQDPGLKDFLKFEELTETVIQNMKQMHKVENTLMNLDRVMLEYDEIASNEGIFKTTGVQIGSKLHSPVRNNFLGMMCAELNNVLKMNAKHTERIKGMLDSMYHDLQ